MHVNSFDYFWARPSLVHRLDPRVKVVVTLFFILSSAMLPDGAWLAFIASWGVVLLVGRMAQVPPEYLLKRSLIAIPFALAAVTVIFTMPGPALVTWQWGTRVLQISEPGMSRFASILLRSWVSVQMAILLTAVTQFPDILHALRHLRVPHILIAILSFMYRYLFVLADEAMRLLRAREARSARPMGGGGGGSLIWRAKVAGGMAGQLFLRSFERSDRVYNGMLARGYRGRLLTMNPHVMSGRDWLAGGIGLLMIGCIQAAARLF
jgi:cobalt/nickel transport system permease protein